MDIETLRKSLLRSLNKAVKEGLDKPSMTSPVGMALGILLLHHRDWEVFTGGESTYATVSNHLDTQELTEDEERFLESLGWTNNFDDGWEWSISQ